MDLSVALGERKPSYRSTARSEIDGAASPALIGMDSEYEVRAWCASLGCSYQQLRAAVFAVGHSADAVQDYLATQYLMTR